VTTEKYFKPLVVTATVALPIAKYRVLTVFAETRKHLFELCDKFHLCHKNSFKEKNG
jgi:hypothetical protein